MAYCSVSLINLYLHTEFCSKRKNFLWIDVQTHIEDRLYQVNLEESTCRYNPTGLLEVYRSRT